VKSLKDKNILVTGGSGFVGSNLLKKLLESEANLFATLHESNPTIHDDRIQYIKADLRTSEDCSKALKDIDYVFMCAANTSGAKVMASTPLVHLTPNILMNVQMLEAAYKENVSKFLFISTNTVYPLTDFPVKEGDVTNEFYESYHIVAWMKRFTEIICDMYSTRITEPMKTIIVRPGNLYGPYDKFDWEKSKVLPALMRRAIERHDPFEVWGDGNDLKDFLFIDDFIEALISALVNLEDSSPINIASGIPITIKDALKEILIASNYEGAKIEFDSSKPSMIPKRLIDISLAESILGFKPQTSFSEGIKKTIDWYKDYYSQSSPEDMS
jgi:GDP-L-fucose synthase